MLERIKGNLEMYFVKLGEKNGSNYGSCQRDSIGKNGKEKNLDFKGNSVI